MKLNDMAKYVHKCNKKWWMDLVTELPIERNKGEMLMLVVTELAEAVEGIRKDLMDDKLPHRKMEEVEMADAFIRLLDFAGGHGWPLHEVDSPEFDIYFLTDNKAECIMAITSRVTRIWNKCNNAQPCSYEITLVIMMIQVYCQHFKLDLMGAYKEKMAYNLSRVDHSLEHRKAAGGKKF